MISPWRACPPPSMEGVTMAGDDPVRICLEELRGSAEIGAARRMARELLGASLVSTLTAA